MINEPPSSPASSPTDGDLSTLLPLGGVVMTAGQVGGDWARALAEAARPAGRVIAVSREDAEATGLDTVAEREKLLDLHLLIIAADADAGRVLGQAGRMIDIFEPVVALLGPQRLHDSLLDDLGYNRHPLPSGLMTLLPAEDA